MMTTTSEPHEPPAGAVRDPADQEPEHLIKLHLAGDPEAFEALIQRYRAPVYSYLARTGVAPEDRDDLFQEVFVRVHRAAAGYDPGRPFHPWIFTIVANLVRNHRRRLRVRALVAGAGPSGTGSSGGPAEPVAGGADAERRAAARQTVARVARQLQALPVTRREVVLLHCVEGLSLSDVAAALGIPLGTAKTHLRRARQALVRSVLGAHGESWSEVTS
jgi:RNA polymerase sigma-70 factor (ECF subfamily)